MSRAAEESAGDARQPASGGRLPGYRLEEQIGNLLRRAHQRASAIFLAELGEALEITPTQFAALVKLRDLGEQSQNKLGRLTAMDPATIQGVIGRLVERGLIERSPDLADRRRSSLRLTKAGEALVDAAIPKAIRVSDATLERLGEDERRTLLALLRKLV